MVDILTTGEKNMAFLRNMKVIYSDVRQVGIKVGYVKEM